MTARADPDAGATREAAAIEAMSGWAFGLDLSHVPAAVVSHLKLTLLDTFGAIIAGSDEPQVRAFARRGGNGRCSVVNIAAGRSASRACVANGAAGTWKQLDEANFPTKQHPALHVVPALFALSEEAGSSGLKFLEAFLVGYELCGRLGRAASLRREDLHGFGSHGVAGAAMACARLGGAAPEEIARAGEIGAALSLVSPRRPLAAGSTAHNLLAGAGGQNALLAAELAACGFDGAPGTLMQTFGRVLGTCFDIDGLTGDLGVEWLVSGNLIKRYACCADAAASVCAVAAAVGERRVAPGDIAAIDIETYASAAEMAGQSVDNEIQARFSIPYIVAAWFDDPQLQPRSFTGAALADGGRAALMRRTRVGASADATAAFPARQRADAVITLSDGGRLTGSADFVSVEGGLKDRKQIEAKFMRVSGPIMGPDRSARLIDEIMALDQSSTTARIGSLLRGEGFGTGAAEATSKHAGSLAR